MVSWAGQWIINEWAYLSLVFLSTSSSMPACRLQQQRQFKYFQFCFLLFFMDWNKLFFWDFSYFFWDLRKHPHKKTKMTSLYVLTSRPLCLKLACTKIPLNRALIYTGKDEKLGMVQSASNNKRILTREKFVCRQHLTSFVW